MMSQTIRWILMGLLVAAVGLPDGAWGQSSQERERERTRTRRDISPFQTNGGQVDPNRPSNRRESYRNSSSTNASNQRPGQGQQGSQRGQGGQQVRGFTRTQTTAAGGRMVGAANSGTTGTAASRGPRPGAPGGKGGQGIPSGAGFAMSGKINEVTKSMADSLRPMRVDYDAEEMSKRPSVIILNPRRYQTGKDSERSGSGRHTESLVQPL